MKSKKYKKTKSKKRSRKRSQMKKYFKKRSKSLKKKKTIDGEDVVVLPQREKIKYELLLTKVNSLEEKFNQQN